LRNRSDRSFSLYLGETEKQTRDKKQN